MYSDNMESSKHRDRFLLIVLILSFVAVTVGCSLKPPATGEIDEIIVLASDGDWLRAGKAVKEVFERIIETPQFEKTYTVSHPPLERFELYKKYHNLVLLGTLESEGIVDDLLNKTITPEDRVSVASGEQYAFQQRDLWASDQYMLILVAPTIEELVDKIKRNHDRLYQLIDKEANRFLKQNMYKHKEQVEISNQLFEDYGFTFRVQHDYFMKDFHEHNAVFFRRLDPDRMLLIHWVDTSGIGFIPEEWVLKRRDELGGKVLDGRVMNRGTITTKRTEFAGYAAVEARGLWLQPEKFIGGPMIIYTFFDARTSRIYMIDLSLFAPDYVSEKKPFLRQLEIIAGTFTTNPRATHR